MISNSAFVFIRRSQIFNLSSFIAKHPTEETSSVAYNIEWTDEKHSLYLKSMEASFVDQLYNLKDMFSWYPSSQHGLDENFCRQGSPAGSSQFKVHQHSHWPKKLRKTAPPPEVVDASESFLVNPWSKYFKSGGGSDVAPDNDEHQSLSSSYGNISELSTDRKHNQVSFNLNEECSGQNFSDDHSEDRAPKREREKRLRTEGTLDEINDQVVPFGISCLPMQDRKEGCSTMQDRTIEQCGQATKTESAF